MHIEHVTYYYDKIWSILTSKAQWIDPPTHPPPPTHTHTHTHTHTRTRFLRGYRFESSWTLKIFLSAPSNDMAITDSF